MKKLKLIGVSLTIIVVIGAIIVLYLWLTLTSTFTWGYGIKADAGPDQTVWVNQTVIFNGSGSYCCSGCMGENPYKIIYLWDFDDRDGIGEDAMGECVTHMYAEPGIYNVTLTIIRTEPVQAPEGHKGGEFKYMDRDTMILIVVK